MLSGRKWDIILHAAVYAAEEMGVVLKRTSYSPNIRDRLDFSCAVLAPWGELVAQAEHIPVHLGSMAVGLRNAIREMEKLGMEIRHGDVIAVNDPYIAGTHLNDLMLIKPVFHRGELVAFVANKAHHVDVGGQVPGSVGGTVEELVQEGFRLPVVKLADMGRIREDIIRIFKANVRTPEYVEGDIKAQLAALNVGERMIARLAERYGGEALLEAWRQALYYTERYARRAIAELKVEGEAEAEDYIEPPGGGLAVIRVKLGISGEKGTVIVDYSGTDPQLEAPLNAVYGVTVAATLYALKSIIDPEMPMNGGFERSIKILAPEGTIVNPRPPAPVSAGNTETSQRIADVVFRALAEILPGKVPAASCGSMNNLSVGGEGWAFYETIACGSGARPIGDGIDGVHTNMTNTLNTPIEVLEKEYPILFTSYRLRPDSGGPGTYRGGLGVERAFIALQDGIKATITGERVKTRPWGLAGGLPGEPAEYLVVRRDGAVERLPSKATVKLNKGDKLIIRTPGGGGYGPPGRRPRELILRDLEEGRITSMHASLYYDINV